MGPSGWGSNPIRLVTLEEGHLDTESNSRNEGTQGEGGHRQGKEGPQEKLHLLTI